VSRWTVLAMALAAASLAAACGRSGAGASATVRVFAASSLTGALEDVADAFEASASGAGVDVTFQFGASSTLAQQLRSGATADVFASADAETMARGAPGAKPVVIARNRLALVVERGNPKGIDSLDDLDASGIVFVLCAPAVPCGRLGAALLAKAGTTAKPASYEENVKAVVSKVALGEADAGVVYETDVAAARRARAADGVALAIADDPALEAVYPMAVLSPSPSARAFGAFVTSDAGQRIFRAHGFLPSS
jgi:molybdate transport system substrate-binding protein